MFVQDFVNTEPVSEIYALLETCFKFLVLLGGTCSFWKYEVKNMHVEQSRKKAFI